jgi:hypothetical protein
VRIVLERSPPLRPVLARALGIHLLIVNELRPDLDLPENRPELIKPV